MSKPLPPCKDCDRRTMTCHIVCNDYKQFMKDNDAFNALRSVEIEKSKPVPSWFKTIDKAIKRKRRNK